MDTIQLLISVPERLTPENSPFKAFSRNLKNIPQSQLNSKDYSKEYGLYFPTVKYLERPVHGGISHDLRVEFSAPKLIFNGDNLREVTASDYEKVVKTLYERLLQMGFDWITYPDVVNTSVSRLDVCKNIIFEKESDITSITRILKLGNMGGMYEPINKNYSGGGRGFGFGIKNETVTVYDKGAEMRHCGQVSQFSKIPVLRLEVKMGAPSIIEKRLKESGIEVKDSVTLADVFKEDIWKALLMNKFNIWYNTIPKINIDTNLTQVYLNIARSEAGKRGGYTRATERFAWYVMATSSGLNGAELDDLIESFWGKSYKYRIRKIRDTPLHEFQLKLLLKLKKDLEEFKLLDETDVKRLKGG